MTMRALITTSLFLALVALPASAGTLKLKNGTNVTGHALRYDSSSQTLFFHTDDGKDVQYTLDQLDARTVYMVNASQVPKDDAQKQLMVANFARDSGLFAHAARRYAETLKTDPSLKAAVDVEMSKLRRMAAEACMKNAQAAIAKRDLQEAERWLTTIVDKLPGEPEAARAKSIIETYYAKNRATKMAEADAKASEAQRKTFEKGKQRYDQMVEKCSQALQANSSSQAEQLFQGSLSDGKALLKEIESLQKKPEGSNLGENAERYRKLVIDQMVETNLHLASQKSVQSDYKGALKAVNAALALDPKSESALSARARVEDNSSNNRLFGWN